jgi:pilus assembly protein Flp/PilA
MMKQRSREFCAKSEQVCSVASVALSVVATTPARDRPDMTGLRGRFFGDDEGASMIEYAFLVALIAIVIVGAALFFGTEISNNFSEVGNTMQAL